MSRFEVSYLLEAKAVIDASDISDVVNRLRAQNSSVEIISIQKINLGSPMSSGDSNIISSAIVSNDTKDLNGASSGRSSSLLAPVKAPKAPKAISRISKRGEAESLNHQPTTSAAQLDADVVTSSIASIKDDDGASEDWAVRALSTVDDFEEPEERSSSSSSNDDAYAAVLAKFSGRTPAKAIRRVER